MKKLIPMMVAAACAFGVYADGFKTVSDFEGSTPGETLDPTSDTLWSSEDKDGTLTFTAYVEADKKYTYGEQTVIADTGVGNNYLAVDNSKPLYRNAADGDEKSIASEDLYIDTLVKFTVTDADTTPEADTNAKLALWLQAGENEGDAPVFKIRCGQMEGSVLGTQDITIAVPEEFDAEAWHRLTVRAVKGDKTDDMGTAIAEFEVFLDGEALQEETVLACVAGTGLTGVGFKGNGAIDDVSFTDVANAPTFAIPPVVDIEISWDTDEVAGLTIGEKTLTETEVAAGAIMATPKDGVVSVTGIVFTDDYTGKAEQDFTQAGKIVAEAAMVKIGDVKFATFGDALKQAKAGDTLKLVADVNETSESAFNIGANLTLDLAGKTYTVAKPDYYVFDVAEGMTMTVISSVAGGAIVADAEGGIFNDQGKVVIGATVVEEVATIDAGLTITGMLTENGTGITIYNGKFDVASNNGVVTDDMVAEGYVLKTVGDYLVVQENAGPEPEPTTYELTLPTVTGATAAVTDAQGTTVADLTKIAKDAVVTVTWTADTGYEIVKGYETQTITVTADVTAATPKVLATMYTITYVYTDGEAAVEGVENDNLTSYTIETETITIDTALISKDGYTVKSVDPETIEKGSTGNKTVTVTLEENKGGELPGEGFVEDKTAYQAWAAANGITTETEATTDQAADFAVAFLLGANKTADKTLAEAAQAKVDELITAANIDVSKLATGDALTSEFKAMLAAKGLQAMLVPTEEKDGLVATETAAFFKLVIKLAVQNAD